jgi:hypothetical protein
MLPVLIPPSDIPLLVRVSQHICLSDFGWNGFDERYGGERMKIATDGVISFCLDLSGNLNEDAYM